MRNTKPTRVLQCVGNKRWHNHVLSERKGNSISLNQDPYPLLPLKDIIVVAKGYYFNYLHNNLPHLQG